MDVGPGDRTPPRDAPRTVLVVPCGGAKRAEACPAAELYVGSLFRDALRTAQGQAEVAARAGFDVVVTILSAKHGLLTTDTVVEPYDLRMTAPGSVSAATLAAQLLPLAAGRPVEIFAFLPRAYLARLRAACGLVVRDGGEVTLWDLYETARGLGYQKQVLKAVRAGVFPAGRAPAWQQAG